MSSDISVEDMLSFRDEFSRIVEQRHIDIPLSKDDNIKFEILQSIVCAYRRLIEFGFTKMEIADIHKHKATSEPTSSTTPITSSSNSYPSSSTTATYPSSSSSYSPTYYSSPGSSSGYPAYPQSYTDYKSNYDRVASSYNLNVYKKQPVQTDEEKELLRKSVERALNQYNIIKAEKWVQIIEEDDNNIEYESSLVDF